MLRLSAALALRPTLHSASSLSVSPSSSRSFSPLSVTSRSVSLSTLSQPFISVTGRSRSLPVPQSNSALATLYAQSSTWVQKTTAPKSSFSTSRDPPVFQVVSLQAAGPKDLDDIINYSMQTSSLLFTEGTGLFYVDKPIYPMAQAVLSLSEADAKGLLSHEGKSLAIFVNQEVESIGVLSIVEALSSQFQQHHPEHDVQAQGTTDNNQTIPGESQEVNQYQVGRVQFLVKGIRRISVSRKDNSTSLGSIPASSEHQHDNKLPATLSEGQNSYKGLVINGCSSLIARHPRFTSDDYYFNNKTPTENQNDNANQPESQNNNQGEDQKNNHEASFAEMQTLLSKLTEDQVVDLFYLLYLYTDDSPALNLKFLSTMDTYSRIIEIITNQTSSEVRNAFHRSLRRRILAQKRLFRSVFFTDLIEDLLQLTNSKPDPNSVDPANPNNTTGTEGSLPPFMSSLPPSTNDERVARRRMSRDSRRIKVETNNQGNLNNNQKNPNWNEFLNTLNSVFTPSSQSSSTSSPSEKEREREKERETALSRHKQQTLFLVQWPLFTNPLTAQFRTMNQLINNLHLSKDINNFIQNNNTRRGGPNSNPMNTPNPFMNPGSGPKNPFAVGGGLGGMGGGQKGAGGAGPGGFGGMLPEGLEKNRDAKNIAEKAKKLKFPPNVKKVYDEEMLKLASMPPSSSEYHVSKSYLDWLTSLPWGIYDHENLDISNAEKILDEDHYGLEDLKTSILEFISIGNLKGTLKGKVLCFVGPPGTGKTSIGKSIARALGRKFYRFSVGGLSDMSEIKGHRRTYVGAMPGKIIHGLKVQQSSNPVILLDEIDKLSRGYHGDPAAALLEVLDPEQNANFTDHYLDVPYDLSRVLFICTANSTDTISKPLLDRMEVLRLSGYVSSEKVQIAQKYLIPKILEKFGLKEAGYDISMSEEALMSLANEYCREAGIRNLEKKLEAIFRKISLEVARSKDREREEATQKSENTSTTDSTQLEASKTTAEEEERVDEPDQNEDSQDPIEETEEMYRDAKSERERQKKERKAPPKKLELTRKDLRKYLGKARFLNERYYDRTPIGVVVGLAWSEMGGSTLYIETVVAPHTEKKISITGKLGEVMQESVSLAYTYAKSHLARTSPDNDFFVKNSVHMHFPEGAVPKDGPSAGIAIITSLISLARGIPIKEDLAMTGEVTLTGLVLAVGGIKEKLVAAQRSGIKTVLIPFQNKADVYELDRQIISGLEIHFVENYDQVEKLVFEQQSKSQESSSSSSGSVESSLHEEAQNEQQANEEQQQKEDENDTVYIPTTISSVSVSSSKNPKNLLL